MNKGEREELRRLLRSRFKVLRADVAARKAELQKELQAQIVAEYAAMDKMYDEVQFAVGQAADEANRKINDLCRELYGREIWGERHDRRMIAVTDLPKPGLNERAQRRRAGEAEIETRVTAALLQLDRRENELLMELATSALESAQAREFFDRIPAVTELVPAYRLAEITGDAP